MLYPKIPSVWLRESEMPHDLLIGQFREPEFTYLSENVWFFTEKIDGTNIRVIWDGHSVSFAGRTNKAIIPDHLAARLAEMFGSSEAEEMFERKFGDTPAVLYGEGYGTKIQKNGEAYTGGGVDFILFDVLVGGWMLVRDNVEEIANSLGIKAVPVTFIGTLEEAITQFKDADKYNISMESTVASKANSCRAIEGWVGQPLLPLRSRSGNRVIVKLLAGNV